MAQKMRKLFPGRSAKHALGAELRRTRLKHGLSQAGLGALVHHSGALVGKIEKAERLPTREFCALVDEALVTGGRLSRMWPAVAPRVNGVPAEFVLSPWNVPESLQLLRELTGVTTRHSREYVALNNASMETVLAGWRAATPALGGSGSADTPAVPLLGPTALDLIATRLAGLRALNATLDSAILRDLVLAELRCLTCLIVGSTLPEPKHRRLLGLTAQASRLAGDLHQNRKRPGKSQSFYLLALRCAADAGDPIIAAEVLAKINEHLTALDVTKKILD